MKLSFPVVSLFCATVFGASLCAAGSANLRLSGGTTRNIGRLEVFENGLWGTICDDGWQSDFYYTLACCDLGFSQGRAATDEEKTALGPCAPLPILWDDTHCDVTATSLFECQRKQGPGNCQRDEDVFVVCSGIAATPPPQTSTTTTTAATTTTRSFGETCDMRRHRITPYDPQFPWIGRAEVLSPDCLSSFAICDDFWDDHDAEVFCKCFSGSIHSGAGFKAIWRNSQSNLPAIEMLYSEVHCTEAEAHGTSRNIFHCNVKQDGKQKCDVTREAAGVACGPVPTHVPKDPPKVTVSCDRSAQSIMEVCFESGSSSYKLNAAFLKLEPECAQVDTRQVPCDSGLTRVCATVNMGACRTSQISSNSANKTYCYDVQYSEYDRFPGVLMTDTVWNRLACCDVPKNRTVTANFVGTEAPPSEKVVGMFDLPFNIKCYTDQSFSGQPLAFPANVTRGQDLFCKVEVNTWDENLFLVVPRCQFSATSHGSPHFEFWAQNCPQSNSLPVSYYNLGPHTWGLQFTVPLFQNHQSLFLTCGSYVCDRTLDEKPYCDRSCNAPNYQGHRRKKRGVRTESMSPGERKVNSGEFYVVDNGFGPLITADGSVVDVEAQEVQMQVGTQVKSVAFRDLQLLPETAPKRNAHLIQQPAARSVEPARKPARVDHGEKPAQSVVPGSTGTHCSPCHFVVYSFPLLMLFYILF